LSDDVLNKLAISINEMLHLRKVKKQFALLEKYYDDFQDSVRKKRRHIEQIASQWAMNTEKHDFPEMVDKLIDFSNSYDEFISESLPVEDTDDISFSSYVLYIKGIASYYAKQPEVAKLFLKKVIEGKEPEMDENLVSYTRRVTTAHHYLSLIDSDFDNQKTVAN
jgi:hypothetical protein